MSIRVGFLGGLGEVGRNCAFLEVEGRIAMIDCGLMFPEEDMWGVDLVLPDWRGLLEQRGDDVRCVILTHAHEDHMGGLGYFLRECNVPVYGTDLALAIAAGRVEELGAPKDFRVTPAGDWVEEGPFRFMMIPVSHSVPEGCGVAFDTPEGLVVHTGDFKLDPTPIDSRPTDLPAFARLGERGVRLLLSDSTNAEREGVVPSERTLAASMRSLIREAPGRVIATCFASHLHRVQQIADAGLEDDRYLAFLGRSMERNVRIAGELGALDLPEGRVVAVDEALELPPHRALIVTTGSQGEPFSALTKMAAGRHRWVDIDPTDTVIISATPIPGNETSTSRVISDLMRRGARVFHGRNAHVHVSGHAAAEELKILLNVVRPQTLVPVHGEFRHLRAHAGLGEAMGTPEVLVLEDGDAVVIDGDRTMAERGTLDAGLVYVDGSGVGDVREELLAERGRLSDDGAVVAAVAVDYDTGRLAGGPRLVSRGFADEDGAVLELASEAAAAAADAFADDYAEGGPEGLEAAVKRAVRKAIKSETGRRPEVVAVAQEV